MFTLRSTNKFDRELKRQSKRGKDMQKFKMVAVLLEQGKPLAKKYRDHELIGNYANRRECHLEPDWLLIYKVEDNNLILERTGSHSDLF